MPATPADQEWLLERIDRGQADRVLLRLDDSDDVAGHMAADPTVVRVVIQDDEMDTVGHAISVRLPNSAEAEALRRRILLTGVLVGAVVLGSAGVTLAVTLGGDTQWERATTQIEDVSYEDSTPFNGTV